MNPYNAIYPDKLNSLLRTESSSMLFQTYPGSFHVVESFSNRHGNDKLGGIIVYYEVDLKCMSI